MVWYRHLWSFVIAVYDSWVSLVSGVGSIVLTFLIAFWGDEWLVLKDNKTTFIVLAIACFTVTMFTVWYKERRALEAEQAKNTLPNIDVEIQEVYPEFTVSETGKHPHHIDEYYTVSVHLTNKGRPIAVRRFELLAYNDEGVLQAEVTPLDHLAFERKQRLTPKWGVSYSKVETVQKPLNDLSQDKTLIAHGEGREGWLRFVIPELSNEQLDTIKGITLFVVDAESNIHKAQADKAQWKQSGNLVNTYHQEFQREVEKLEAKEKAKRTYIHDSLGDFITQGREIEAYKLKNSLLYEHQKPLWRGRVFEFLRGLGGTYAPRFQESDLEGDITTLEEIQKEFIE